MYTRRVSSINWIFALLFSLCALIFILLIVLSGVGGHVVADYLTINTKGLNIPAKLGGSEILQDLSSIAGEDWVGSDVNAKSLELPDSYSLNLLTACANDDGSTVCGQPKIGFNFDPSSDLHLDSTSIQGTFSSAYSDQLQTYSKVSTFLGAGYIIATILTVFSVLSIVLSLYFPRAIIGSVISSGLALIFLWASAIAATVMFFKLRDVFNDALGPSGIETRTSSRLIGLGFGAAGLTLSVFILVVTMWRSGRNERRRDWDNKNGTPGIVTGTQPAAPAPMPGLLRRFTTWSKHKYTQVERQKPVLHNRSPSRDADKEGLIASVEDDFSHEYPGDLAMGPVKKTYNTPSRDPKAAYDPHVVTSYDPLR
ncbi:hypothetical protein F5Y04DRAFT_258307 [Hypomontagnella monticulosa]|nr:hypothetical protein F5Y04DRAFT_258307 [Hypomontagnella monticulosa]